MNAKRFGLVGLTLIAGVLTTVLLVHLAAATPQSVEDAPFGGVIVSGTVASPDAGPLPAGTFVWLHEYDPAHLFDYDIDTHGRSNVVSGTYSFANVAPGRYILRAVPRDIPPFKYAPSAVKIVNVFTVPLVMPLTVTFPSVTGTLYAPVPAPDFITPTTGIVHVYTQTATGAVEVERRWVWPENNGVFAIGGLPAGQFKFRAEPFANEWYWWSNEQVVTLPHAPISITLKSPQIKGVVVFQEGATFLPVSEAWVYAWAGSSVQRVDQTGTLGRFAFADLPPGVVTLTVKPPPELNWLMPPAHPVTAVVPLGPGVASVAITMTVPDKQLHGWVRTNEVISQPVRYALVQATRVGGPGYKQTHTNLLGNYDMTLGPGLWAIKISPVSSTVPSDWVYPFETRLVEFDSSRLPEHKWLNFRVLLADATVMGAVELPPRGSGTPPNFTVTVSLRNDEGIGLAQELDAGGRYAFEVPHGPYKLDLRVASPFYAAPPPKDINARPVLPTNVPTITLIPRNALITGTVTEQGSGNPVADVPIIAWNPDTRATFGARTGPNGVYYLNVYSDTWLVRPAPQPDQPYIYTGEPASIQVNAFQVINQDLQLTPADATIHGVLVDAHGAEVTDVRGYASATDGASVRTGAPVEDGFFDILVPGGKYTVTLHIPNGQDYLADGRSKTALVTSGMSQTVTFTLAVKDAMLRGVVWNTRTDKSLGRDVEGRVWAWDDGLWTATDIKPGNYFTLPVPAGEWRVNYAIDPDSDYIKTAGPRTYAVPSGAKVDVPLPVVQKDGLLTGTVWLSASVPARGAVVIAEGISADIKNMTLRAPVDYGGRFTLTLPSGLYNVRSVLLHNDPRQINPRLVAVNVPRNGSASVTLMYRRADAAITGSITALNLPATVTGPVYVYGWTADDGYNSVIAPLNGVYTLPVLSGMDWKVSAVYEWPNKYWITRTLVTVPATHGVIVNQNLVLAGPKLKPAPVTVVFDALQDQYIELADGTRLFIPGGALPATGRVILHVTPIANAVHHRNGDVLGLNYVFEAYTEDGQPITDSFNQDVVIVFKYDPAELLAMGININHVRPAYFSTTTNSWTAPDSFVVDEEHHEITMQIDHFTKFGILNTTAPIQVFLPVVIR